MANNRGTPMSGDRGAFNTEDYPTLHGRDIEQTNHQVHLTHLGNTDGDIIQWDGSQWRQRSLSESGVAPNDADYVTLSTDSGLDNERVLTGTANQITITDNGAGSTVVLSIPSGFIIPGTITIPNTGLHILDTGGDHDLILAYNEDATADRTLNIVLSDGTRSLTIEGDAVIDQDYSSDASPTFAGADLDGAVTINDSGADVDMRVESANQANMLVVDGGADTVLVGGNTDLSSTFGVHVVASTDIGQVIKLAASQSANAVEIQKSDGTVLSGADERGILFSDGNIDSESVYIGSDAGNVGVATGLRNVGIGFAVLNSVTTGGDNTGIGRNTLTAITEGGYNTALGTGALDTLTTGSYNFGLGGNCFTALTTSSRNIGVGYLSGGRIQTGSDNIFMGYQAGYGGAADQTSVDRNIGFGYRSLYTINSGADENVAIGYRTGYLLTTGDGNIFIGPNAGYRQTTNSKTLIIDSTLRADAATELSHAIIYGTMATNPEDQSMRINVDDFSIGTDADADVVLSFLANTNSGEMKWMEDEDYFEFTDEVQFADRYVGNTATTSAAGPTDNYDADSINVLYVDCSGGNVTIGGFINGVSGQVLHIVVVGTGAGNTFTLEDQEGTGNQDAYLVGSADLTITNDYGGVVLVCNGTHWYEVGH